MAILNFNLLDSQKRLDVKNNTRNITGTVNEQNAGYSVFLSDDKYIIELLIDRSPDFDYIVRSKNSRDDYKDGTSENFENIMTDRPETENWINSLIKILRNHAIMRFGNIPTFA